MLHCVDPLLLEVTLHELQFRLDEQEKLTLEAFKRIQELEKLLFQPLEPLQLSDINIGDVCDPPPLPETYNYEYNSTSPAIPQTTSTAIPQIHPNPNNYNNYQQEPHQLSETSLVPPQCQPIESLKVKVSHFLLLKLKKINWFLLTMLFKNILICVKIML